MAQAVLESLVDNALADGQTQLPRKHRLTAICWNCFPKSGYPIKIVGKMDRKRLHLCLLFHLSPRVTISETIPLVHCQLGKLSVPQVSFPDLLVGST